MGRLTNTGNLDYWTASAVKWKWTVWKSASCKLEFLSTITRKPNCFIEEIIYIVSSKRNNEVTGPYSFLIFWHWTSLNLFCLWHQCWMTLTHHKSEQVSADVQLDLDTRQYKKTYLNTLKNIILCKILDQLIIKLPFTYLHPQVVMKTMFLQEPADCCQRICSPGILLHHPVTGFGAYKKEEFKSK